MSSPISKDIEAGTPTSLGNLFSNGEDGTFNQDFIPHRKFGMTCNLWEVQSEVNSENNYAALVYLLVMVGSNDNIIAFQITYYVNSMNRVE
jgi:hypothetical protein